MMCGSAHQFGGKWSGCGAIMGVVATSLIIIRQTEAARDHPRCWKGVERTRAVEARERESYIYPGAYIPSRGRSCVSALPLPRGGSLDPAHLSIDKEMAHKVLYSSHAAAAANPAPFVFVAQSHSMHQIGQHTKPTPTPETNALLHHSRISHNNIRVRIAHTCSPTFVSVIFLSIRMIQN